MTAFHVDPLPGASAPGIGAWAWTHLRWLAPPAAGLIGLLGLWWLGGLLITSNARLQGFAGFAPLSALAALQDLVVSGDAWRAAWPSLWRVLQGLLAAFVIGMPVGILAALVVLIGLIGFGLDAVAAALLARTRWTPTA